MGTYLSDFNYKTQYIMEDITYMGVNELRVGSYVVVKDRPCKILSMTKSKTGKHGSAKAIMDVKDLFKR